MANDFGSATLNAALDEHELLNLAATGKIEGSAQASSTVDLSALWAERLSEPAADLNKIEDLLANNLARLGAAGKIGGQDALRSMFRDAIAIGYLIREAQEGSS